MKATPWILFLLAVVALCIIGLCNKADEASTVPKDQYEALQKQFDDSVKSYRNFKVQAITAVKSATERANKAEEQAKQSQALVDRSRSTVNRLLAKLDSAEKEKPDSSWVQVSPNYKEGCDSLRHENAQLGTIISQYEQDNQAHVDALNYETHLRDSLLERERQFNADFQRQANTGIAIGKKNVKESWQKLQVYGGFAAWGSQANPLAGGEINIALKTPGDQIYEVKGAMILNTWYVGAGTKFKFHF
jgi:septal ring factor EnvC (AmiA/AmiB activator)